MVISDEWYSYKELDSAQFVKKTLLTDNWRNVDYILVFTALFMIFSKKQIRIWLLFI